MLNLLQDQTYDLSEQDIDNICQRSDGYSGSDMSYLCKEAALGPMRTIKDITKIQADQLRPIQYVDFDQAFQQVRASVSQKDLKFYEEWDREFGSAANRPGVA